MVLTEKMSGFGDERLRKWQINLTAKLNKSQHEFFNPHTSDLKGHNQIVFNVFQTLDVCKLEQFEFDMHGADIQ